MTSGLVSSDKANSYFSKAEKDTCLIKSTQYPDLEGGWLTTQTKKGQTVLLDWKNSNSSAIVKQGLEDLFGQVPFDAVGLSDNEFNTVCNGECPPGMSV